VKQKVSEGSNFVSNLFSGEEEKDTSRANENVVNIDSLSAKDSANAETEAILENYTIINSETNTKIEPKMEELTTVKKVHIIAGSFKQKQYAQRQRNKLNKKGFKATVLPESKGLYRVSVASYDNIESAVKDFDRIKSIDESLSVWILINK
ncbi:MAG: SPOR domain-containing protein, partial [Chloroflexia bacterium]|nr:SPOR domain-containing protein [Chloroflexia bacterium]